jgi:hypothetical protein
VKRAAQHIVLWLLVFIVFFASHGVVFAGDVSHVRCNVSYSVPATGAYWSSGEFSGEYRTQGVYLPFNTPIDFHVTVTADGAECGSHTDGNIYARLGLEEERIGGDWLDPDRNFSGDKWLDNSHDDVCDDSNDDFTSTLNWQISGLSYDDLADGVPLTHSLAIEQSVYWEVYVKKTRNLGLGSNDAAEPDPRSCKIFFGTNYERNVEAGSCLYQEACSARGETGTRQCVGVIDTAQQCSFAPSVSRCTACFICGRGTCHPGCTDQTAPEDPAYEPACAELRNTGAICGNGICEAGEGMIQSRDSLACPNDCDKDEIFRTCDQVPSNLPARDACVTCEKDGGLWTAIGCIPVSNGPIPLVTALLNLGMSLGGGVALLRMLLASFTLSTAGGDVKRASEAKETFVSAVSGLFFIIFSVSLMKFIAVTVLRIPGFGN